MHSLELQPAMDPVQPGGTIDIHRRAQLFLSKGLAGSEVRGRHPEMGECDLHVQEEGDAVGDEDEEGAGRPGGD